MVFHGDLGSGPLRASPGPDDGQRIGGLDGARRGRLAHADAGGERRERDRDRRSAAVRALPLVVTLVRWCRKLFKHVSFGCSRFGF